MLLHRKRLRNVALTSVIPEKAVEYGGSLKVALGKVGYFFVLPETTTPPEIRVGERKLECVAVKRVSYSVMY